MKIYLIDVNQNIIEKWQEKFKYEKDVEIIHQDLHSFLDNNPEIEAIVSPANSFGIMNGGYDLAITRYFGDELQKKVQTYIYDNYFGEQVVGTSCSVLIPNTNKCLIHTPTMRFPSRINDPQIVYHCMRSTLIEAHKLNLNNILIPAFGGATGGLNPDEIANQMYKAYRQINDHIVN